MRAQAGEEPLRSSQLARLAGVSTDTLRHYERKDLLHPRRSANGYREYPPASLTRVLMVRRALSVGFSLNELARVLRIRDAGGAPCRQVRALAATKLESLEAQIRYLTLLRNELRALLKTWDADLARTPRGKPARLLDRLLDTGPNKPLHAAEPWARRGRGRSRR